MGSYKVLITTSGTGSRLGELTKYTNKSLVKVGKKPAISYIVEAYPPEIELVVTLGYKGNFVKDFLTLVYPERTFTFIDVPKYEGPGSSLGASMLAAENELQCPFIFHACDTIVTENIPAPEANWVGGYIVGENTELDVKEYRTHKVENHRVLWLNDKGVPDFQSIHIGLTGVKDYRIFWKTLREIYEADPESTGHSDVHVIDRMMKAGVSFDWVPYSVWYDTGNPKALERARKAIADRFDNLEKVEESTFFFDGFVIKFFHDAKTAANRVVRAKVLSPLVPPLEGNAPNFYRYRYIPGELYANAATSEDFPRFLHWAKKNIWVPQVEVSDDDFRKACRDFYETKTKERIKRLLSSRNLIDMPHVINGEAVPSLQEMIEKVDFGRLSNAAQTGFHGDFILDNIIKTADGYCLLDWRQDFGGLTKSGDLYYDLAKLNHNLTVNHDIIHRNLFSISTDGDKVSCDITRKENLVACQKEFFDFIESGGYDLRKVKMLTALIWLNMAPLHHHPFDQFLYYFGKLHLWRALQEK